MAYDFAKKYENETKTIVFASITPRGNRILNDLLGHQIKKVNVTRGSAAEMFEEELKRQPPYDIEVLDLDLVEVLGK
tara:strand:- start:5031 stop:5261 length:231 start_codon:yes stop_codon:yes gene_type:complete